MKQNRVEESAAWLRDQRHRAINMLLGLVVLVGPLGLLPGLRELLRGEGYLPTLLGYTAAYVVALVLFVYRRMDDRWRTLGLLILAYAFAVFALFTGWLAGSGRLLLLSFTVMAALLLSTETGFFAAGLSILTYIAYGFAFNQGLITLRELPDPTSVNPILVEGVGFLLVTGMAVMIPWFFSQALTAAFRANQEAQWAETLLAEHAAQLEVANEELEAFAYSVSHDLRAPLRAVDGFSRILLEDYAPQLPPEAQRYVDVVRGNAQRMGEMIEDLLTFSRLGQQELRQETVFPRDLVEQVLAVLGAEQSERQVVTVVDDLPPCQADPGLLGQGWRSGLLRAEQRRGL
jgi:signal transduction histidine kinase